MSDKPILHATLKGNATDEDHRNVRDALQNTFPEIDVVVTTDDIQMHELPALDNYMDELADRIVERLEGENHE